MGASTKVSGTLNCTAETSSVAAGHDMDTTEVAVQGYSSAFYDTRYQGYGKKYHLSILEWMMHGLTGRLLDAGCGTGFVSQQYHVMGLRNILGIDLSPGMLKHNPYPHEQRDVCHLPLEWYERFDGIICRSLLHHLPNHQQGLSEMHRVVKSGGKVAFWETSKSAVATWVRSQTQHGDRFSEYHHSFTNTELLADINKWFEVDEVRYIGFLGYPLYGFPDIVDLARWIPFKSVLYPLTMGIDSLLERTPCLKRWSWSLGIKAHKM